MLCSTQGHVCFRAGRRCAVSNRWPDESLQSLHHHRQCGEMVVEERRQLAQLRPSAPTFSLSLCCEPEGASLCAGGLDTTGTQISQLM